MKIIPFAGNDYDKETFEAAVTTAQGFILAFDGQTDMLPESALDIVLPKDGFSLCSSSP